MKEREEPAWPRQNPDVEKALREQAEAEARKDHAKEVLLKEAALGWRGLRSLGHYLTRVLRAKADEYEAAEQASAEPGRAGDRNLDMERGISPELREQRGTVLVVSTFFIAIAGGIGFIFLYWTGGNNQLLGGSLALCLAGMGATLVLWAHWLMRHTEATERREPLPSPPPQREATLEAFCSGATDVRRRRLLQWMSAAGLGVFAAIIVSVMRSLGSDPSHSLYATVWKHGQRLMTVDGKPVRVDSLEPGSSVTVFPEDSIGSEKSQTALIRVPEFLLQLPKDRAGWAPQGYLAYSRICTHAGCPVGLYERTTYQLLCPCHQSTFDVLKGAAPTGGPAARALPQLPLYVDSDGTLRAAGGFSEPPGPGFWGLP
jgi:ubiquinol-cytochrome c reductase iron-sulfur subunit